VTVETLLLFLLNPSALAKKLLVRAGGKVVPRALAGDDSNVRTVRVLSREGIRFIEQREQKENLLVRGIDTHPMTTSFGRACMDFRFLLEDRVLCVVRDGRTSFFGFGFDKAATKM